MTPSSTPSTYATPTSKKPSSTLTTTLLNYAVFAFLSLILLCLILLTPADAIYQCFVTHRLTNIFIITGGYVVTFLLVVLIYATRIYTNRTVLSGIPKAWIPVEREDVGKSVRRLVVEGLRRSALVAYGARPRDLSTQDTTADARGVPEHDNGYGDGAVDGADIGEERKGLLRGFDFDIDPAHPPWGPVEHPGWSAPSAAPSEVGAHLPPGLCYRTVIRELPHLIEAKAVSLAPPDPIFAASPGNHLHTDDWAPSEEGIEGNIPDTRIVEILRRPATTSLRGYMHHLTEMGLINPPESGTEFLSLYERARFSGRDLHDFEFRELMSVFADVLRGMRFSPEHLDPDHLFLDMDMDINRGTSLIASETQSESILGPSDEEGETETDTLGSASISLPANSPVPPWATRTPSTHSLRPVRSHVSGGSGSIMSSNSGSGSGGSVIRLVDPRTDNASGLPYVIHHNR
ncbi:hypothetical protein BJX63DRAFT_418803 [Aspergillus granulosus]|uniref:Defect at low temperature protein 1 n=1 Tax=Aspergillus granulosus TaxID=176169 RepID=A0ABR4HVB5_9EURO